MLRTRTGEQLDDWLGRVKDSQIRELQGFVAGVIRDKEAVKAGLTLPANNGIVEGKVNKLKLMRENGLRSSILSAPASTGAPRSVGYLSKICLQAGICSSAHRLASAKAGQIHILSVLTHIRDQ
nr:transposase [Ktedonobacter robiniae]